MKDFSVLENFLSIKFDNKDLLIQAFCHRSYLNEHPEFKLPHQERLEFLGDAVLELIVTEYLFTNYPNSPEGDLTKFRAALVNSKILSEIARKLSFENFLLLSRGEEKERGKGRQYILANTFEAFLGALYLDKGFKACRDFILKHLIIYLDEIIEKKLYKDAKSRFQEEAQERLKITPTYRVLKETGPNHAKHFVVGVFLNEELVATGEGYSKQEAEEAAAERALKIKKW